ncbi:MAG: hypothetical protein ACI8VT_003610 [Saprospiraceae bacterium]|jgi:hypothetical protein
MKPFRRVSLISKKLKKWINDLNSFLKNNKRGTRLSIPFFIVRQAWYTSSGYESRLRLVSGRTILLSIRLIHHHRKYKGITLF